MHRRGSLVEAGVGLTVLAIFVAGVAIPITSDVIVTDPNVVTNETIASPTGSTPETLTLDQAEDGVIDNDRLTVFLKDAHNGSVFKLEDSTVNVLPDSTEPDLNITDQPRVNSTNDLYNATYDGKPAGYIGGTLGFILDYVVVGLGLALLLAGFRFALR